MDHFDHLSEMKYRECQTSCQSEDFERHKDMNWHLDIIAKPLQQYVKSYDLASYCFTHRNSHYRKSTFVNLRDADNLYHVCFTLGIYRERVRCSLNCGIEFGPWQYRLCRSNVFRYSTWFSDLSRMPAFCFCVVFSWKACLFPRFYLRNLKLVVSSVAIFTWAWYRTWSSLQSRF